MYQLKRMNRYTSIFMVTALLGGLAIFLKGKFPASQPLDFELQTQHHQFVISQANQLIGFNLVDPGQAPLNNRDSVLRGYRIIMNTPFYAPTNAGGQISCTNCHFLGGDTLGGKNGGISLVGSITHFPHYSQRDGKVISLAERINSCFERSLNGRPLSLDSPDMQAIVDYLNWISSEVNSIKSIPWLGLKELSSSYLPDPKKGEASYQMHCALCHQSNGQGGGRLPGLGKTIPPIWGNDSFNDGAGMSQLPTLAAFIYWNMPYQEASLTEEEAWNIASFVLQQPRPHFVEEQKLNKS